MHRAHAAWAFVTVFVLFASPALAAGEAAAALKREIDVEERLLADALRAYAEARDQEKPALAGVAAAAARFDEAVARASTTPEDLDRLAAERAVAEAAAGIVTRRVDNLRTSIAGHLRRSRALRVELTRVSAEQPPGRDPISGRWRIEISAPPETGIFDLKLDGAQVSGSFSLAGGRAGSLKGTYAGGRLRLERIDTQRGPDGIFEGNVDAALGTVRGFWSPSILADGGPGGSGWSGVRVATEPTRN